MKTSVHFVNTITKDGEHKSVNIVDENGNLKYNFLIELASDNALIWDSFAQRAFVEIAKEYKRCKNAKSHK